MKNIFPLDFEDLLYTLNWIWVVTLLGAIFAFMCRLYGITLVGVPYASVALGELRGLLMMGLRFDLAVLLRACLIFILITMVSLCLPTLLRQAVYSLVKLASLIILFLFVALNIGNLAYMDFFGKPYDEFVFEGMLYDIGFIVTSMSRAGHTLYYMLAGLLITGLTVWISYYFARHRALVFRNVNNTPFFASLLVVVLVLVAFILARGSVSSYPLMRKHTAVNANTELNYLVENGAFALYEAYRSYSNSDQLLPPTEAEGQSLLKEFYGRNVDDQPVYEQFTTTTTYQKELVERPPHVVFGIVESFSSSLLDPNFTGSNQLASALQHHLQEDVYFPRFLPAHMGTQGAVVNMLTNIDFPSISQSKYRHSSLDYGAAKVYRSKGYKTLYVSAAFETEYNNQAFFLQQGFDEYIGAYALQREYPEMSLTVQGAQDYYVFAFVKSLLEKSEQPLFVVAQTINNHPPYEVPLVPGIEHELVVTERMRYINGSLPDDALRTYYNSAEIIGDFISHIKDGRLASNTVFAFTGDHGARGLRVSTKTSLSQKAVPLYIYLPTYLRTNQHVDKNGVASHRDIMPTLYNLTLSEARYLNLGRDLLGKSKSVGNFALADGDIVTDNGLFVDMQQGERMFESQDSLILTDQFVDSDPVVIGQAQAYIKVLDWLKRYQLHGQ